MRPGATPLPPPSTRTVRAVRLVARLLLGSLLGAGIAGLAACGSGAEQRYDALPGPVRTVDLAIAASEEQRPLSEDEWASLESMHDRYLTEFDRLREETLGPLAREVRAAPADQLAQDAGAGRVVSSPPL